jgi:3-oxoacyl-[acyl-carrier protein] reductase
VRHHFRLRLLHAVMPNQPKSFYLTKSGKFRQLTGENPRSRSTRTVAVSCAYNDGMKDLKNRVALVTGASRGIGAAVTIALARAGADIAVNYRDRADAANAVCRDVTGLGRKAIAVPADVSVAAEVNRMVAEVSSGFGAIDILVNNAGIVQPRKLEEITEAEWDEVLTVNLKSVFLVTQAVVGGMRQRRWGRIINLSSVAAQTGGAVGPHYAASKAGIIGLTHSCASLFVRDGITVNAIAPALIETEMVTNNPNARSDLVPMGHFGSVDDVASVAVMLATNDYMTGQTISVNGGWYMS